MVVFAFCSKAKPVEQKADLHYEERILNELEDKARELTDKNGWLVHESCDSILWTGRACLSETDLAAAETSGKFFRTPSKQCFDEKRSGSSWSRDMSLGLLHCLIINKDLAAIERHIEYGERHSWVMGDGLKSRTAYSPALIGLWYKAARKLGHNYHYLEVPNLYPAGLKDYQANLQMFFIYLTGKLDGEISSRMLRRIIEHSNRVPSSPFYSALKLKYNGIFDGNICSHDSINNNVDYLRCDGEPCELAEAIFACRVHIEQGF